MTNQPALNEEPCSTHDPRLGPELLEYAASIEDLGTPADVLDRLHSIVSQRCGLNVLGAGLFPVRWGDMSAIEEGKTVFLHKSAPRGWWDEYLELIRKGYDPGLMMALLSLAPYTWSESLRMLEPLAMDRWSYELRLKYGMRDGLTCPAGGRWVVVFWSRRMIPRFCDEHVRPLLFLGATYAAIRLQALIGPYAKRVGKGARLTPRELAVLRALSLGKRIKEAAEYLELGEETVRSHLKKAQAKLGAHGGTHAVAQAIRDHLIP